MKLSVSQIRTSVAVLIALLAVWAWLSWSDLRASTKRLEEKRSEVVELEEKIAAIKRLSQAPRIAALDVEPSDTIVNRINEALSAAGLARNTLANQTPAEPRRIAQSDFTLRLVEINLRPAPLEKIVRFCEALRDEKREARCETSISLLPNRGRAQSSGRRR